MNLGSLLQDILSEVSSRIISFQMRLHLLITLVKSSEYFRFIESLRTCIMASQNIFELVAYPLAPERKNRDKPLNEKNRDRWSRANGKSCAPE